MKPYHYTECSTVFDFLSSPDFFPVLPWFMTELVCPHLAPNASVTDVGGGTGQFTDVMLNHLPDLKVNLVEPSPEMMQIAKKRLQNRVTFYELMIDAVFDKINKQDAFIFQRSLYAIYTNEAYFKSLLKKCHENLNPHGKIFIQNINEKYDTASFKAYLLEECAKTPEHRQEINDKFQIYEKSLITFNELVDSGEFHLFAPGELENDMTEAGFKLIASAKYDCYAFEKM